MCSTSRSLVRPNMSELRGHVGRRLMFAIVILDVQTQHIKHYAMIYKCRNVHRHSTERRDCVIAGLCRRLSDGVGWPLSALSLSMHNPKHTMLCEATIVAPSVSL